jgi:hypothetical protein
LIILYFAEIGKPRNLGKLVFKLYVLVFTILGGGGGKRLQNSARLEEFERQSWIEFGS